MTERKRTNDEPEFNVNQDENATGAHAASARAHLSASDSLMMQMSAAAGRVINAGADAYVARTIDASTSSASLGANILAQQAEAAKDLGDTASDVHENAAGAQSEEIAKAVSTAVAGLEAALVAAVTNAVAGD